MFLCPSWKFYLEDAVLIDFFFFPWGLAYFDSNEIHVNWSLKDWDYTSVTNLNISAIFKKAGLAKQHFNQDNMELSAG